MQVSYQVKWDNKVKNGLNEIPNDILYMIAKLTLAFSVATIPKDTNKLRATSVSGGVRSCPGGYYIGSFTDYASSVWKMNDSTTNWTTSGTHSQWYARTLKEKGKVITDNAINQSWKDRM